MSSLFKPLQSHLTREKRSAYRKGAQAFFPNYLRDQFGLLTWLSIGAIVQLALLALPIKPYYAATPVVAYLAWSITDLVLMLSGVRENVYETNAIREKYTAIPPDEDGQFTRAGSKSDTVTILLLGFKNHSALGPFAPGYRELTTYATRMFQELEAKADEYNFLGLDTFNQMTQTTTGGLLMTIMYFKSTEDVHRYANGPLHREAWDWYNRFAKTHGNLGIMHETYEAPAGQWENVYKNIAPTGFAVTQHRVYAEDGTERWISPIVDANKGRLSSSNGRYQ